MGAPSLTQLQTVVRESLQNSCDASTGAEPVRCQIRLRRLTPPQVDALRELLAELPADEVTRPQLQAVLGQDSPLVMEISDWGTSGLGGPTRADKAPPSGVASDFVNFIRNVGAARDTDQGGGTYGYGKTALYGMSACGTIIVDTLTTAEGAEERRLIGCHVGHTYDSDGVRYTGRHWWGQAAEDRLVEPLSGLDGSDFAGQLGLPARGVGETGTTVAILAPLLTHEDLTDAIGEIEEIILWFFWPKMVDLGQGASMEFLVGLGEDAARPVARPELHTPLDLLVDAFRKVRSGSGNEIRSKNPARRIGMFSARRGRRLPRRALVPPGTSIIPHTLSHIAVMRPVELVVRYYDGTPADHEGEEWGGVFICDSAHDVERAFADAEPPAHDDWMPENLPRGPAKTFVNVALRELKLIAAAGGEIPRAAAAAPGDVAPSLARVAERMGRLIPAIAPRPDRLSGRDVTPRPTAGRASAADPIFLELIERGDDLEALFLVELRNPTAQTVEFGAEAGLVIDGVLTREKRAPGGSVEVVGWSTLEGAVVGQGAHVPVDAGVTSEFRLRVTLPPGAAVGATIFAEVRP